MHYNACCLTLAPTATPDPFIVHALGKYFLTFTTRDHIEIWACDSLADFKEKHSVHIVWRPPPDTDYSALLWAPELHPINGRWHVYVAGSHPKKGNISHRMYVLGGPPSDQDPTQGPWEFLGRLQGLPDDQWAIDGTVFPLQGSLYFVYSGWPLGEHRSDLNQELFIVRMSDATHCHGGPNGMPVQICKPDLPHEITHDGNGAHGINEGPQWLIAPNAAWAGIVYSAAGSWTNQYKMCILKFDNPGGDPLDARNWVKDSVPLCQSPPGRGPWGPGHGNFLNMGGEVLAVFHATDRPDDGWANRKARCQRVAWHEKGPTMGGCVGQLTSSIDEFTKGPGQQQPPHHVGQGGGVGKFDSSGYPGAVSGFQGPGGANASSGSNSGDGDSSPLTKLFHSAKAKIHSNSK